MCMRVYVNADVNVWSSGATYYSRSFPSFHRVDLGDRIPFVRLGGKHLYSVSPLTALSTSEDLFSVCGSSCSDL